MENKHRSKRRAGKPAMALLAVVLILALLIGGAFAWTDFSQYFINRFRGGANNDALLHDDFDWSKGKKDIYVENTGETALIVRLRLDEFLQIGNSVKIGRSAADTKTYVPHKWENAAEVNVCALPSHEYFAWHVTGEKKLYLRGTSEFGWVDYEDAAHSKKPGDIGPNGQTFEYTAETAAPIMLGRILRRRRQPRAAGCSTQKTVTLIGASFSRRTPPQTCCSAA